MPCTLTQCVSTWIFILLNEFEVASNSSISIHTDELVERQGKSHGHQRQLRPLLICFLGPLHIADDTSEVYSRINLIDSCRISQP